MPAQRFAVLCVRRTGSNLLCGLLNSHPAILCHAELFNEERIFFAQGPPPQTWTDLDDIPRRSADPQAFLQHIWARELGHAAVGFKLLDSQEPRLTAPLLSDPGLVRILLERRSRLRTYVSWLRAAQTGRCVAHGYDGLQVVIRPQAMLDFINFYNRYYAAVRDYMRQRGQPWLDVFYEDLVADPAGQLQPVLGALGVDPAPGLLQVVHRRQSRDRLRDSIANYDKIAYMLRGSVLEPELDADETEDAA